MQFHHLGYVSTDPRVSPAEGVGRDRPDDLPDEVDVLIVGSGPAGMLLLAQLAQYPEVRTRLIERRPGRLEMGRADGLQARSIETFEAFGFADRITAEAYLDIETSFWGPDADASKIIRKERVRDEPEDLSEYPHLLVNQARVLDYLAEAAHNGPSRLRPNFGFEFVDLMVTDDADYPVSVTVRETADARSGGERVIRAKYVAGCDGAHSRVREAIGGRHIGNESQHAWGVMDILPDTDFPDIRLKCVIQSREGSILLIPREGGHLVRFYVDLGEVSAAQGARARDTPLETIIAKAQRILSPFSLEVRDVPWWSVYEVGHRITDRFDDAAPEENRSPRVFICGDACHTHSAKGGQGMNVSLQDGFNLGWKLGSVLSGRAPASLLSTYSEERREVAQDLIDFDLEWATLMAKKPGETNPEELADYLSSHAEFPAGFATHYRPSMIIGSAEHQHLATGFPIGKRFASSPVVRVADAAPVHLGHHARADGRWRIYVFADQDRSAVNAWAQWAGTDADSPLTRFTPPGSDLDRVFDVKVIYQQQYDTMDVSSVPDVFLPRVGPFQVRDYEKAYGIGHGEDIFAARGVDRGGCIVVVRPDQYVAHVLPLDARSELTDFFAQGMRPAARTVPAAND